MIAVVDYAKGNLQSVQKGLEAAGAHGVCVVTNPADIAAADAVVLPGVGAFADASRFMLESGQMDAVRDHIGAGKPFLGICLGLHLLFEAGTEHAEEGEALPQGLGIIEGVCERMPSQDAEGNACKVPHMGWNSIDFVVVSNDEPIDAVASSHVPSASASTDLCSEVRGVGAGEIIPRARETLADSSTTYRPSSPLLEGIDDGEFFYFTHSYIAPDSLYTQATTTHSTTFPCFVDVGGTCFGIQFHPEKSSDAGLAVLRNFVKLAR